MACFLWHVILKYEVAVNTAPKSLTEFNFSKTYFLFSSTVQY